ncbi:hypothetical protein BGZ65_002995, partial [Modicella reniformis]
NVVGYTPSNTSSAFIPHGVGAIIVAGILSMLMTKVRSKIILVFGWLFLIASSVLWAQIRSTSSYWAVSFPAVITNMITLACIC